MPNYIQINGDIPIGKIASGDVVLSNVVIETAVPYKPPTSGGIRDRVTCEGDNCTVSPEYKPTGDRRAILLLGAENTLMTVDDTDMGVYLASGWKLVGLFDAKSADKIADQLAAKPPVSNAAIQKDIFWRKSKMLGMAAAKIPLGAILLQAGRERSLREDSAAGKIAPLDLDHAKQEADFNVKSSEISANNASVIAKTIEVALKDTVTEIPLPIRRSPTAEGTVPRYRTPPSARYLATQPTQSSDWTNTYIFVGNESELDAATQWFSYYDTPAGLKLASQLADETNGDFEVVYPARPYVGQDFVASGDGRYTIVAAVRARRGPLAMLVYDRLRRLQSENPATSVFTEMNQDIRRR